jgi:hypothetical protein
VTAITSVFVSRLVGGGEADETEGKEHGDEFHGVRLLVSDDKL